MNVVLSLMQRDQWATEKISFWTYYICFVVYSGSAQNLHPCPIIKSSILVLMTTYSKNLGTWPLWTTPGYAYGVNHVTNRLPRM